MDYQNGKNTGKKSGIDFFERKFTIPLIHLFNKVDVNEKKKLLKIINNHNLNQEKLTYVKKMMKKFGSINYCLTRAEEYVKSGIKNINHLENFKDKEILIKIAEFIILRNY